jgi:hypothetical protein
MENCTICGDKKPPKVARSPPLGLPPANPQKFSHRFFMKKTGFESIMVTSPFFDVSRFVFQKSPAQTAKWTFIWTLDTLPYLPQSPHHKYIRVSVYETIYRNVQVYHPLQIHTAKTGGVTYVSTESSILGDQISNEIFSARKYTFILFL